jgi:hypothetical protein
MAELILTDGRTIDPSLKRIQIREYRELCDPKASAEQDDTIMAKACGVQVEEIAELSAYDYKAVYQELVRQYREPIINPP